MDTKRTDTSDLSETEMEAFEAVIKYISMKYPQELGQIKSITIQETGKREKKITAV